MVDIDAMLASAEERIPTRDVKVCLDGDIAREREELLAALEVAEARDKDDQRLGVTDENAAPIRERLDALTEAAKTAVLTLRFTRMPGHRWAELTSLHPVRTDSPIDRHYGYNYDAVAWAAAVVTGVIVEGDTEQPMTPEQWQKLLGVLAGSDVQAIRDAVWALNEYEPSKRLNELVKGFGAAARSEEK